MTAEPHQPRRYSIEEYVRLEKDSSQRHEFYDGEIIAMAGGSPEHSLIIANIIGEMRHRLKGSACRVFDANLRVRIPRARYYVYPDVTIVCGPVVRDPEDPSGLSIINPTAVIEVLSPTTEHLDYGRKFTQYIAFESVREYILVTQKEPRMEGYFRRNDGTWLFTPVSGTTATLPLRCVEIDLPLAEVYAGIEFTEQQQ